jgi:hypothetical protein
MVRKKKKKREDKRESHTTTHTQENEGDYSLFWGVLV